jgi:hypothetical protein
MGLQYWKVKTEPDEVYLGWDIFIESESEIGQTTGMFSTRGRAVRDGIELTFYDPSLKSRFKVKKAILEKVKIFQEYKESLKNTF